MANQADVGDEEARYDHEDEGCSPGGNLIWSEAVRYAVSTVIDVQWNCLLEAWIGLACLHDFCGQQQKHPYTMKMSDREHSDLS